MTERRGRRFRPTLWATVCTALALAVLLGLGTWQVQRLQWKTALIAERQARAEAPPMALPARIDDPAGLQYRRVRMTGRFLHDREMRLGPRTLKGAVGVHLVTPLLLADGRGVLVDRGWIPVGRRGPVDRPGGEVTVTGVLRAGGGAGGWFRPDNAPEADQWYWPDLPAMAARAGLDAPVTALYVQAVPAQERAADGATLPVATAPAVDLPNNHLVYAVTWYALAAGLLVIYILFHLRRAGPGGFRA